MPGGAHGRGVIQHIALRFLRGAEVGRQLLRFHDHLTQEQNAGTDDLAGHIQHPGQRVDLGQITTIRSQLLPDIGNGIETNDVNALICQKQQVLRHVVEDHGIAVVEVPLIGMEEGHDDLAAVRKPGEIPRRGSGKHLWHGLLVLIWDIPVVKEEVPAARHEIPCPGRPGPGMIAAGVIHDKIQTEADIPPSALIGQSGQILHCPQLRLYGSEIGHRIASVALIPDRFQKRHQMQIIGAALF